MTHLIFITQKATILSFEQIIFGFAVTAT